MSVQHQFSIIDVFSNTQSDAKGNPSAVILLDNAMSTNQMQEIGKYLRQPATTFLWPSSTADTFEVRWFAPDAEIELCGHGSMAASIFLSDLYPEMVAQGNLLLKRGTTEIQVGILDGGKYFISMESIKNQAEQNPPRGLAEALGQPILSYHKTENKDIVLLESQRAVKEMSPDFDALREIDVFGYAITAKGEGGNDFVCRTLVPHVQQLEDQATGSTQAILVPFWAKKLSKRSLISEQLSQNGGYFEAHIENDQITLLSVSHYSVKGNYIL